MFVIIHFVWTLVLTVFELRSRMPLCLRCIVVIIVEKHIILIELLSCVYWSTLISLITLWQLFLLRHIKIIRSYRELFHICLWINILNTLIYITNGAIFMIEMILRLTQVLKLVKTIFVCYNCFTYKLASLWRWLNLILIDLLWLLWGILSLSIFLNLLLILVLIILKFFYVHVTFFFMRVWVLNLLVHLWLEVIMIWSPVAILTAMWSHLQWSFFVCQFELFFLQCIFSLLASK
jgi:hypothetical protein